MLSLSSHAPKASQRQVLELSGKKEKAEKNNEVSSVRFFVFLASLGLDVVKTAEGIKATK